MGAWWQLAISRQIWDPVALRECQWPILNLRSGLVECTQCLQITLPLDLTSGQDVPLLCALYNDAGFQLASQCVLWCVLHFYFLVRLRSISLGYKETDGTTRPFWSSLKGHFLLFLRFAYHKTRRCFTLPKVRTQSNSSRRTGM